MTDFELTQLGITGALSLLLVREVLSFVKSYKSGGTTHLVESAKHAANLENELRKLNHAIANLTQILSNMHHEIKSLQAEIRECRKDIDELRERLK